MQINNKSKQHLLTHLVLFLNTYLCSEFSWSFFRWHPFIPSLKWMMSLPKLRLQLRNFFEFSFRFGCILILCSFIMIHNRSHSIRQKSFIGILVWMWSTAATRTEFFYQFWCFLRLTDDFTDSSSNQNCQIKYYKWFLSNKCLKSLHLVNVSCFVELLSLFFDGPFSVVASIVTFLRFDFKCL